MSKSNVFENDGSHGVLGEKMGCFIILFFCAILNIP